MVEKDVYFHTMEYYSAIRNDKLEDFIYKWMYLEHILISKINQTYICKYHIFSTILQMMDILVVSRI